MNQNTKISMEESRDSLYQTFKKDIEKILNKEVFSKLEREHTHAVTFEEHQRKATEALLVRLRTQKFFYEMKVGAQEAKLKAKTEEINRLHHEIIMLQNTLTSEQYKSAKMSEEIQAMHIKNVKID